jgi:DNA modification methylase
MPSRRVSSTAISDLTIISPKRTGRSENSWEGFFPYYAGFPESFALSILKTSLLPSDATVLDPGNGSGTTTYAASRLGHSAIGFDINPVMVVVGRARLLAASEADSINPIKLKVLKSSRTLRHDLSSEDPLSIWFGPETARIIRSLEESIRSHLVGSSTITPEGVKLENLSGMAAAFYVSLFSTCRSMGAKFQSSNPTWLRHPRIGERRLSVSREKVEASFDAILSLMAHALQQMPTAHHEVAVNAKLKVADSTSLELPDGTVDMVLTSPPYCTRIDYAAATRIELAILAPLLGSSTASLRGKMMGSLQVPRAPIHPRKEWGQICLQFLNSLRDHSSKASASYYHKTHLDYFDKLSRSTQNLSRYLKNGGSAIVVVQDS